jgi:hypothetical protein
MESNPSPDQHTTFAFFSLPPPRLLGGERLTYQNGYVFVLFPFLRSTMADRDERRGGEKGNKEEIGWMDVKSERVSERFFCGISIAIIYLRHRGSLRRSS